MDLRFRNDKTCHTILVYSYHILEMMSLLYQEPYITLQTAHCSVLFHES